MPSKRTFSPADILAVASSLREDGAPATLCFGTDEKPIHLGGCQISAVRFPDGETWAVRVPVHAKSTLSPSALTSFVEAEMAVVGKLNQSGFRWAPRLIGGDSGFDNSLGHPYLVLTWIHGTALEWSSDVTLEQRHKVLGQLIDIQLELAECTKESRPDTSVRSYLTDISDGKIMRVASGTLPELDYKSCFVHRVLVRYLVDDGLETQLFALSHGNLAAHKIIVDAEYNITGIVDWKLARLCPLPLALGLPRLLATDVEETDRSVSVDSARPSPILLADRDFAVSHLSSLTTSDASPGIPQHASPAKVMKVVVADPDVGWKDLVYQSCYSKGLHRWMAKQSWLAHEVQRNEIRLVLADPGNAIEEEIEEFLRVGDR